MNAQILRSEDPIEDSHTPSVTPSLFDLRKTEFESGGKARALFSDSPGGSAIDEENRTTLIEALMIYHALEAGRPLGEVARMSENIHAFGIGHFLHNAMTKELLRVEMRPGDLLNLVYLDEAEMRQRDPDRRGAILRHRVIEILRNRKIIAPTYARNLRPAGTTPCLKSIGQLVESTTKIPLEDITSPSRVAGVVQARFQAIWGPADGLRSLPDDDWAEHGEPGPHHDPQLPEQGNAEAADLQGGQGQLSAALRAGGHPRGASEPETAVARDPASGLTPSAPSLLIIG